MHSSHAHFVAHDGCRRAHHELQDLNVLVSAASFRETAFSRRNDIIINVFPLIARCTRRHKSHSRKHSGHAPHSSHVHFLAHGCCRSAHHSSHLQFAPPDCRRGVVHHESQVLGLLVVKIAALESELTEAGRLNKCCLVSGCKVDCALTGAFGARSACIPTAFRGPSEFPRCTPRFTGDGSAGCNRTFLRVYALF